MTGFSFPKYKPRVIVSAEGGIFSRLGRHYYADRKTLRLLREESDRAKEARAIRDQGAAI